MYQNKKRNTFIKATKGEISFKNYQAIFLNGLFAF